MSFRKAISLACGIAGGSVVLVCAAVTADKHGYFGERCRLRETLVALHAAQPTTWPTVNGWDNNWDKRDPSSMVNGKRKECAGDNGSPDVENNKPKATRHIFLIRHSQYNLKGDGDKERILTPLGREQAEYTGQRLAVLGLKYDVLIHSSMTRATETAHIISKYLPGVELVSCDLLREGAPIEPVPPVTHWKPEAVYHEDGARIEAAFRRYIHRADPKQKEDSYEIIVCHANVIRYFVCRALQFPPEGWLRMGLNNGSITWLTIRPSGRVALRALGDSGFMPPDKLTRT
ncbi:serine/threonine-protein phosphatase PGAM5, mitochondrial isoform X2 [Carassius auratus]|uniref:Serine/threonine-protein phosphatase PGAM5, mitochondrial n=1 Tax=Carassius auratus TaxID=7957 RepID=A0A6P6N7G7_CARAU|nr:serine/threonine-protein phosphatase PGAM5, mitochondrial-like isoform X2 [Carassius auratus]XP_052452174.1 serine/threonine-protein phosphatase PGAM5, mitochondrial isoform X2 [Carassius gibelio]